MLSAFEVKSAICKKLGPESVGNTRAFQPPYIFPGISRTPSLQEMIMFMNLQQLSAGTETLKPSAGSAGASHKQSLPSCFLSTGFSQKNYVNI